MILTIMMLIPTDNSTPLIKKGILYLLLIGLSIIVRLNPHSDIPVYISSFSIPISDLVKTPYYLKEGLFWIPSAFLHQYIFKSEFLVLLFWDCITFALLLKICKNTLLPYSFVFIYLLSFMGVLTFQNIYRQYIATILFLYALTLPRGRNLSPYIILATAVLIHSSIILLTPVFILYRRRKSIHSLLFILLMGMGSLLLLGVITADDSYNTGLNLNTIYLFSILFVISFLGILILSMKERMIEVRFILQPLGYLSILALIGFISLKESLFFERISILLLQVLVFLFLDCIHKLPRRLSGLFQFFFALTFILPIFFFDSTLAMLQNSAWLND
jgi:hypothetical protein